MTVWIETPFDNLPVEGYRRMRYSLLQAAFVAAGHRAVVFASDFNHGTKAPRRIAEMPPDVVLVPTIPYSATVSLRRAFSHLVYARRFERLARRMADAGEVPRPDVVIAAAPTLSAATAAMRHVANSKPQVLSSLVGLDGLEPSTSRLSGARSNQLSYKPIELQNHSGPED